MAVNPIPEDYPRVIPYLSVEGAADAIDFYCSVLGAKERMRMGGPDGKVAHAELDLGDSVIMLADVMEGMGNPSPKKLGGTPIGVMTYVEDVDSVFKAAIDKGAKQVTAVANQFYGDRSGSFEDPWGHVWWVASHVEDVSEEEMERRAAQQQGG